MSNFTFYSESKICKCGFIYINERLIKIDEKAQLLNSSNFLEYNLYYRNIDNGASSHKPLF
jgi:hypothetical protein